MSAAGSDDDLLDDLDKDLDEGRKTGDADSLANIVNKSFRRKLTEDKLKQRFDKFLRPNNCAALRVPLVNKELWKTMSADARKADINASHVQKAVAKAGVTLADSTQALLRAQRAAGSELDRLSSSVAAGTETKEQIIIARSRKARCSRFLGACFHCARTQCMLPMTSRSAGDTQYGHSSIKASRVCAPTPNWSHSFCLGITLSSCLGITWLPP